MNSPIICIGELLIDFFCTDVEVDLVEGRNFQKQAGGAPANVCATVSKLGGTALFSGKVGNDPFGHFLKQTLEEAKVDTSMVVMDNHHPTTLAFVSLKADGERDFVFNRGADAFLEQGDLDKDKLKEAKVYHFGSATAFLSDPFKTTYLNAMKTANNEGKFISFDPNYRLDLWKNDIHTFIDLAKQGIAFADFVKVSEEEMEIITGKSDLSEGARSIHQLGAKIVAVTLGKEGTYLSTVERSEVIPSVRVNSIDSTGAGDSFVGAILYQLAKEDPHKVMVDFEQLKKAVTFSNKVAALVCTKMGAISAIPTLEEVLKF